MIVDCHTHFSSPANDLKTAEHLDACGKVDACIVLAGNHDDRSRANSELSEYVGSHKKMKGFAVFNPVQDNVDVAAVRSCIVDRGLEGAVLYCSGAKFHPAHSRAMRFYEAAEELQLPVFFHNCPPLEPDAILDYAQPYLLDEVARTFGSLKIIIGGMGRPFVAQTLCMIEKHPNVYADLTITPRKVWEVYNTVVNAREAGVMDKLLFGSGYPIAQPDNCIETLLGFNKLLGDTNLPMVPREKRRSIVERDTLALLGMNL